MRIHHARLFTLFCSAIFALSGCGRGLLEEAPQLKEPAADNAAFRPVEAGTIGETKILYGTVVPMKYCCFFDTAVRIEKIAVEVGDYVKEGDIIAYADIDAAKEQLERLNLQLENERQNYAVNEQIAELQLARIAAREVPVQDVSGNILPAEDVSANRIDVEATEKLRKEKETELSVSQENRYYDGLLHEYRTGKLLEAIDGQQKIIREGTLRASHSGYVIYTKSLGVNTKAEAWENIAVLADPEETYIELTGSTLNNYAYKDYEVKYLRFAGKTYEVTELSYSAGAEALARAEKKYPNIRLICPNAPELTIGDTYPVFYREKKEEALLPVIGLDSLKGEKDAYYVYVKNGEGEKEKRFVTIGESDLYYVQIVSGLEAGEEVYYESEARMPASYTEYTAELSDYKIDNLSRSYQLADEQVVWYGAQCDGTVTELLVKSGQEIEAGALLYVLDSNTGRAALADALNNISQENTVYAERIKQFDESLSKEKDETAVKILTLQKELEALNHSYRLNQLEKAYESMAEGNDGSGKVYVYAQNGGVITRINAREETAVKEGEHILAIGNTADDKLLVQMAALKDKKNYPENIAEFGETVTITVGETVYQGYCIGMTAHKDTNMKKYYVTEQKNGAAITFCTDSGYSCPAFYVKMEDEGISRNKGKGEAVFSYVTMEDVIAVPASVVHKEENAKNPSRTDYFVWRIEGDELVKQYVLISNAYSDVNSTVILAGVEQKDVLAREQ